MDRFVNALAKFAIITAVIIAALILLLFGMIIFAPKVLWMIVRFVLIAAGIIAAAYLLFGIASALCLFVLFKQYSKSGRYIKHQI